MTVSQLSCLLILVLVSSCAGMQHRSASNSGKVIIVAGSTSCGKSTTAKALQSALAKRGIPYALFPVDGLMETLPKQWVNLNAFSETKPEGVRFVKVDDEKGPKVVLKIGSLAARFRETTFVAVREFADAGINVILEGVVSSQEFSDGVASLAGISLLTAYVDCSLATAQAREKGRGGFVGLARGLEEDFSLPKKDLFDIVVSTDNQTPEQAASKILERSSF